MNINTVIISGNITKDPELRYTPQGTPNTNFTVAVNRSWKDKSGNIQKETSFIGVTVWGKTAESANQYLRKGSGVCVEGRLKQESWEKDGQKHFKVYVIADRVHFTSPKKTDSTATGQPADPSSSEPELGADQE